MKYTLLQIYNTKEAWKNLSSVGKNPGHAYKILRFQDKNIAGELAAADNIRNDLIKKYSDAPEGANPSITAGSPNLKLFLDEFTTLLRETEVEFDTLPFTMEELMNGVENAGATGSLTEGDIAMLDIFFKQPEKEEKESADAKPSA